MNRFTLILLMFLVLGVQSQAFAIGEDDCSVCMTSTQEDLAAGKCSRGHHIHEECLKLQVNTTEFPSKKAAEKVTHEGIPCVKCSNEKQRGMRSQEDVGSISLEDVRTILQKTQELRDFEVRRESALGMSCHQEPGLPHEPILQPALQPNLPPLSPASAHLESPASANSESPASTHLESPASKHHLEEGPYAKRIRNFQIKVEEEFNLCCPKCKGILAPVEGCNAAKCEGCKAEFCYLCLNPQTNSTATHAHAREHSGDYWERRDGHTGRVPPADQNYQEEEKYHITETHPVTKEKERVEVIKPYKYTDRYHWMIVRERLESLFPSEPDPSVREKAIESLKPFLVKKKMWPLPLGTNTERWIHEVQNKDSGLDRRNQIALLQNEFIYLTHKSEHAPLEAAKQENLNRANLVKAALMSLDAPVLSSLDVNRNQAQAPELNQNPSIIPLIANHPDARVRNLAADLRQNRPEFFEMGGAQGRMYLIIDPEPDPARRVAPFVLGDEFPEWMNHADATEYCMHNGERLANEAELSALLRATSPNGRYDRDAIPGLYGTTFWSSSFRHEDSPYLVFIFGGTTGSIDFGHRGGFYRARCVRSVAGW